MKKRILASTMVLALALSFSVPTICMAANDKDKGAQKKHMKQATCIQKAECTKASESQQCKQVCAKSTECKKVQIAECDGEAKHDGSGKKLGKRNGQGKGAGKGQCITKAEGKR